MLLPALVVVVPLCRYELNIRNRLTCEHQTLQCSCIYSGQGIANSMKWLPICLIACLQKDAQDPDAAMADREEAAKSSGQSEGKS